MADLSVRSSLDALAAKNWDVLIIGGGITGAGIFCELAQRGARVLLVEQNDFASGTSSRSSKLIHGGLHYLTRLQWRLAHQSVRERDRLLQVGVGLIESQPFVFPLFAHNATPSWTIDAALVAYDLLGHRFPRRHRHPVSQLEEFAPLLSAHGLTGVFTFDEGRADDARLVLRVLAAGCRAGGYALNYVSACGLVRDSTGRVTGANLIDGENGTRREVRARVVVNATGPWADTLRAQAGRPPRLRLVRGSHLVFARSRLNVRRAIVTRHPDSRQPFYVLPWEGVTLVGSSSVAHCEPLDREVSISAEEFGYLLRGLQCMFPALSLRREDVQATFAGLRPIVDANHAADPAIVSREEGIWTESGLLTVTGGKLTTFHRTARRAVEKISAGLPTLTGRHRDAPIFNGGRSASESFAVLPPRAARILSRYGPASLEAMRHTPKSDLQEMPGVGISRFELQWAAEHESVLHLDDLLLRRLRVGLTACEGGRLHLNAIRATVQRTLGWDSIRWHWETERYQTIWEQAHGVPRTD